MTSRAIIAGATGLIGCNLAEHLVSKGWEVYGVARKPQSDMPGVRLVAADLLEPEARRASLAGIDPTHVFLTTWVRRLPRIPANTGFIPGLVRPVAAKEDHPGLTFDPEASGLYGTKEMNII